MSRLRAEEPAMVRFAISLPVSVRLGVALLLVLALALPAASRVVQLYEVRHRIADELVPLVETVLGAEGRVVADTRTNSLLLSGEPDAVESALALLADLDVRPRTVVLRYVSEDAAWLDARGVRIDWRIEAGSFRVGSIGSPGPGKLDGSGVRVMLDGEWRQSDGTQTGLLRILEGETGRIATGRAAPLVSGRIRRGPQGPILHESMQLASAASGLDARPRVLGDGRIELALRRWQDRIATDGSIETAGAETRAVLVPGETLVIGGLADSERATQRDLSGGAAGRATSRERLLLIGATVEAP